jgi:dihydrofolate reductase
MTPICSVFIATSLDGFIARKDGSIDWLTNAATVDENEDYGYKVFLDSVDTLVMGHNTFKLVMTFKEWPYAGKKVVVLSHERLAIPEYLMDKVEVSDFTPTELVHRLSEDGTRHIYIDGGKTIQSFLSAGLVHEITITRVPILIGSGIPLFGELARDTKLQLVDSQVFKNGFVQSKYRIVHNE